MKWQRNTVSFPGRDTASPQIKNGYDRLPVTIETDWYQRSPYRPSADTICSYADVAEAINTVTEQAFSSVYITQ